MLRLCLIAGALLASSCGGGRDWHPTPGTPLAPGQDATAAQPLPAECGDVANSGVTLNDKPLMRVVSVTDTTVTVNSDATGWVRTVPRHCIVPYALR